VAKYENDLEVPERVEKYLLKTVVNTLPREVVETLFGMCRGSGEILSPEKTPTPEGVALKAIRLSISDGRWPAEMEAGASRPLRFSRRQRRVAEQPRVFLHG